MSAMRLGGLAILLALAVSPAARAGAVRPGAAQAALKAFEAELESHDSATAVLQAWCDVHGPPGAKIVARQALGAHKSLPPLARRALRPGPGVDVRYRRVDLLCGERVLSQADNWYLPATLTPQMNRTLETSHTPFGVVVGPLRFTRRNLRTDVLLKGLGSGGRPVAPPRRVLRHSAVLITGDGEPFSVVVETYTDEVLAH